VIAEVIPGFYDFDGKQISRPSKKRHPSLKGRPMAAFLSQPLRTCCRDMDEVRAFLSTCRYVSDQEQFGLRDYWMPPEQFEQSRQGDCDDFALWTCRQLLALGYNARFVLGCAGRYGAGHAWVSFHHRGKTFILESLWSRYRTFPRLTTLRYRPYLSVEFADSEVRYFDHAKPVQEPPFSVIAPLIPEWLIFKVYYWLQVLWRLPLWPYRVWRRRRRRKRG